MLLSVLTMCLALTATGAPAGGALIHRILAQEGYNTAAHRLPSGFQAAVINQAHGYRHITTVTR